MSERRFTEDEVAAIFERATRSRPTSEHRLTSGAGMTLAQLRDIGREAGIPEEAISEAAQVVRGAGRPTSRNVLGLPLGVGRTIDLGRKLSDDEWERLVVDLRETFKARGSVRVDGASLRQWTNGNLQALLEPTPTGHRVRIRTVRGQSLRFFVAGAAAVVMAPVVYAVAAGGGLLAAGVFAATGAMLLATGAFSLPAWARTRSKQMEEIAERLALTKDAPSSGKSQ